MKNNLKCFSSSFSVAYIKVRNAFIWVSLPVDFDVGISIASGNVSQCRLLRCYHEEANDRIIFHISHAVCASNFSRLIIAEVDFDIFISALYHYHIWILDDLEELLMLCGQDSFSKAVPIHVVSDVFYC